VAFQHREAADIGDTTMRTILLLAATGLLAACQTTAEQRCETAFAVIAAYDAAIEAGRVPSKDEVIGAAVARALIASSCAR
jgi:uncharacterized lipoprotein YajG